MNKEERFNDFIRKAKEKYGDRFDYSKAEYKNIKTEITIVDNESGREFKRIPELHLRYDDRNYLNNETKDYGYWNNKENCYNESLKYINKHQFQRNCYGAYHAAVKNGWLEEFFKDRDYSVYYQDFDKQIHIVYAYEIKEYNACYIGRTLRLKIRDRQHRNGVLVDGVIQYDNLYKFCQERNIDIPSPIVLESGLTAVESQIKEEEYLNKYIDNEWDVINSGVVGENKGSLGSILKWTYDKCKEVSKECRNKHDMKVRFVSAYNAAYRNGWLNVFFVQEKKPNGYWNNIDNCLEEAKKYRNLKEFMLKGKGAYNAVRKNGWLKLIKFNQ